MIETYRGYVDTWECDDVGHMNVQFYMAKLSSALEHFRIAIGLGPRGAAGKGLVLWPSEDHIHFKDELRTSDTVTIETGVLDADDHGVAVYSAVREAVSGGLSATIITRLKPLSPTLSAPRPLPETSRSAALALKTTLPDEARPRSVSNSLPSLTLAGATAKGLISTYRGVVHPMHCTAEGYMLQQHYMGRYSEGGGHFWAGVGLDRQSLKSAGIGIVFVENQHTYLRPIMAGTALRIMSGLIGVGRKTISLAHFMFDAETGEAVARSSATALLLDLEARRSADLTEDQRTRLVSLMTDHGVAPDAPR